MLSTISDPRFSAHAAIFAAAVLAFFKFGDRSELTQKGLEGTSEALDSIRSAIASGLVQAIQSAAVVNRTISAQVITAQVYIESANNFLESEGFRSSISDFIKGQTGAISDYKSLEQALTGWLRATKFRSWILLGLATTELFFLFVMFILDGVLGIAAVRSYYNFFFAVSGPLVILAVGSFVRILHHHDQIVALCQRHNPR